MGRSWIPFDEEGQVAATIVGQGESAPAKCLAVGAYAGTREGFTAGHAALLKKSEKFIECGVTNGPADDGGFGERGEFCVPQQGRLSWIRCEDFQI